MRAPTLLAAVALAGTVLLGGAGQALADNDDMGSAGMNFGASAQAEPKFGQDAAGSDQEDSGAGQAGFGQDASGFGQGGSVFDLG